MITGGTADVERTAGRSRLCLGRQRRCPVWQRAFAGQSDSTSRRAARARHSRARHTGLSWWKCIGLRSSAMWPLPITPQILPRFRPPPNSTRCPSISDREIVAERSPPTFSSAAPTRATRSGPTSRNSCCFPTFLGAQAIDQKLNSYLAGQDFMTDAITFQQVQNGIDTGAVVQYRSGAALRHLRPRSRHLHAAGCALSGIFYCLPGAEFASTRR